jgi:hypothetical protein
VDGRIFFYGAALDLPLHAADTRDDFKMIRSPDLMLILRCLNFLRQDQLVDVQESIDAERSKEKSNQVLVAFLGIDYPIMSGVTAWVKARGDRI